MGSALLSISPLLFLIWIGWIKWHHPQFNRDLLYENGPFEWFQFWCFAISALLAFMGLSIAVRGRERRIALGLGALSCAFLIIALEEVSWGQWIFDLELPSYFRERNTQKNLTLHNLDIIQPHIHLAAILFAGAVSLLCLSGDILRRHHSTRNWTLFLPAPRLTLYFLPLSVFYIFTDWISPRLVALGYTSVRVSFDHRETFVFFSDQESFETILATGCLLYSCALLSRVIEHFCRRKTS